MRPRTCTLISLVFEQLQSEKKKSMQVGGAKQDVVLHVCVFVYMVRNKVLILLVKDLK